MSLNRDFAQAREIIQKYLTSHSGKFVNFIQMFGSLVSFSSNLVFVLWIFNKILELLIFSGKNSDFPCEQFLHAKIHIQKHFWTLNVYL